jgi:general secretion pathway protein F
MSTFQYHALDSQGKKKKGFIEADSQAKAFSLLQDQHYLPVSITPVSGSRTERQKSIKLPDFLTPGGVRLGESFYYLGLLLQTGTSLAESLDLIGRMSGGKGGRVWLHVRDAVEKGEPFSQALGAYPRQFPKVYVGMVRVAESVGRLGQVLEKIAHYEEQRSEVSGKLLTAMAYPAVILVVGIGAVYYLLANVLPNIAQVFAGAKQALPMSTQALLWVGGVMQAFGPLVLLLPLVLIGLFLFAYRKAESFRLRVDALLWKAPLFQKYALARFAGMLGFQLESGIPLVKAMEGAAEAVGSMHFRRLIEVAGKDVAAGQPLDRVLAKQGQFPEMFLLTLAMGQKSGKLDQFLLRVSGILERDVDNVLKRVVALAEPLLILCIGLAVAFIVMAILGPIFDLSTLVK